MKNKNTTHHFPLSNDYTKTHKKNFVSGEKYTDFAKTKFSVGTGTTKPIDISLMTGTGEKQKEGE